MKPKRIKNAPEKRQVLHSPADDPTRPTHVSPSHCPYRQASLLQQALSPDKMGVAFFLGAGCAIPLIPDIAGLTEKITQSLGKSDFAAAFQTVKARLTIPSQGTTTIEDILTLVRTLIDVAGPSGVDGISKESLTALDKEVCRLTTEIVNVRLSNVDTAYHQLSSWIGAIDRRAPVEIFTTNYDLLIEQALEECRVPFFDGFVGSSRPFFDLKSTDMDHNFLPPRWARLWKVQRLHQLVARSSWPCRAQR